METDASKTRINEKIGKILKQILDPKFQIQNDACLNQFLTYFTGKNGGKAIQSRNILELKIQFCQWIIEASTLWKKQTEIPQPVILAFALNLASQLSAYEQIFVQLNSRNVYERLVAVVQSHLSKDPTVPLGLVTLLCSFLEHKSGLQWVMATNYWTDVINLGLNSNTLDIRKKAYYFVQKLLEKTIGFNLNFSINVVTILLKPLKDGLQSLPSNMNEYSHPDVEGLYAFLKPSLDFILGVTDPLLRRCYRSVLKLFVQQETPSIINKYLVISRNEEFSFKLLQIQYIFLFHSLTGKLAGVKTVAHDSLSVLDCKLMLDLIDKEMDKNHVRCIIKICHYFHEIFHCLAPRMPILKKNDCTIEFEMQVIYLQITPICALAMRMMPSEKVVNLFQNNTFRHEHVHRWLKTTIVKSIELSSKWDTILQGKPDLIDDVVFCCQYIEKMKKLLTKKRAAIIFSSLVYSFSDALTTMTEGPIVEISSSTKQYFQILMETIIDLVESFDLTWTDSVETICVMHYAYKFLQLPYWINDTSSVMIQTGLKLVKTTISKYMSPNMALLIYQKDSKISEIVNLVYAKCHDGCGKIRDSSLEVVHTLSINANTKFPAYTNSLLDAKLPDVVVKMAFNDGEYYVRATAFKCLQELIQIEEVWTKILEEESKFLGNLLDVFGNETEGIVRKEAASLIHKIAKYQSFSEEMLPRLFDVMTYAATGDLHWEVKYTALDFWFSKWEEHLMQQGMIDRSFPSHTFSKELKKIVALTPNEIKKRIIKVLHQLAQIGCLHVMICAFKNDTDVEVSRKATEFTSKLLQMFKLYGIPSDNISLSQPTSPMVQPNIRALVIPNQPQTELMTPANEDSTSYINTSSDPYEHLGRPQFSVSPFLNSGDPFSPVSNSPSLDLINSFSSETSQPLSAEPTQNGSLPQNQSPYGNTEYQHPAQNSSPNSSYTPSPTENTNTYSTTHSISPTQTRQYITLTNNADSRASSNTQSSTQLSGSSHQAYPNSSGHSYSVSIPDSNLTNDVDPLGLGGDNLDSAQLESMVISNGFHSGPQEFMLEEYLNPNDTTLVQGIYNPTDKVTNNTIQMKTSTYLAPSQFMEFVYNELQIYVMQKAQCVDKLDEFESLLDDILTKCNTGNVITID